jgi:hypothetical protein
MRFIHYSDVPVPKVEPKLQDGHDSRDSKPIGLWLSVIGEDGSDSWKKYCEQTNKPLGPHRIEIVIKENVVLHVRNAAEIDKLTRTYGYFPECREHEKSHPDFARSAICWRRVAEKYDGIVVAPECVERRREPLWYYTWDCASGCVWSPNAVKELKPLSQA